MDDSGTHFSGRGEGQVEECWAQGVAHIYGLVNGRRRDGESEGVSLKPTSAA